jgi:hypothetical protein
MKHLRSILKWIGIAAGAAIAILLMVNSYFVWIPGTELERRLVALREAGDPIQLADLAREPIPPEKNADVFLRRAADDLDAIQKELLAIYPKNGYPPETVAPADQERLEKVFAAYPKVMPLLEQAADCLDYDPQLDCTLPTTQFLESYFKRPEKHRLLNRILRTRSAWLLSKGRAEDAFATQLVSLRLTRHWRREPLMIGYLVTVACELGAMEGVNRVLQAGPVSPSARQALDAELALHDTMDGHNWALRSERAFSLSSFREFPITNFWLTRGFGYDAMLRLLELYDQYLEKSSRPYAKVVSENSAATRPSASLVNPFRNLVTLLNPSIDAIRDPAERTRALSRSLRVLNAIQARVPSGGDQVPKLTDLGLAEQATIDPYNSEPLHVKKLPEGWLVYSVGRNLVDDGGILDYKNDLGAGPISRRELEKKP